MATDLRQIVLELRAFCDFDDRTVIWVGAGGGQLAPYAREARAVSAIDRDQVALDRLAARLREVGLGETFTLVNGDFLDADVRGDVLVFEFLAELEGGDALDIPMPFRLALL